MAELGTLDQLVDRLRTLDRAGVAIAEEARADVEGAIKATASAGTAPDGTPWAPKKDGGGQPLRGAAAAVRAFVSGSSQAVITLVIRGRYVIHQFGRKSAKGGGLPARPILPTRGDVPPSVAKAIADAARRVASRALGAR